MTELLTTLLPRINRSLLTRAFGFAFLSTEVAYAASLSARPLTAIEVRCLGASKFALKGDVVDVGTLKLRLKEIHATSPDATLNFRGTASIPFRDVGAAIFAAQQVGFKKIGFVAEPPSLPDSH